MNLSQEDISLIHSKYREGLHNISQLFDENGVTYWIDFGTLLGAFRHRDFIPWDDDVDIAISRSDLELAVRIIEQHLSDDFEVIDFDSGLSNVVPVKICFKNIQIESIEHLNRNIPIEYHPNLAFDLFPIDFLERKPHKLENLFLKFLSKVHSNYQLFKDVKFRGKRKFSRFYLRKISISVAWFFVKYFFDWSIKKATTRNPNTFYLRRGIDTNFSHIRHEVSDVFPIQKIMFSDLSLPAPAKLESYLESIYGKEFMRLPSESERNQHASRIWILE